MNKHKGMTLTEVLIALGVVGVLAAISIPQINKVKPNQEMIKFKKAFSITQRVVNELVHDDDLYPDVKGEPHNSGLSNVDYVAEVHGVRYSGDEKFCKLFASRMQVVGNVDCSKSGYFMEESTNPGSPIKLSKTSFHKSFQTVDGMEWGLPVGDFHTDQMYTMDDPEYYKSTEEKIVVDVNGPSGENCYRDGFFTNNIGGKGELECKNPDRFIILVNRSGDVWVDGDVEKKYLESTKTTKSYKQILKEIEEGKGDE